MRARIDAIGARRSRPATGRSPSEGVAGCGLVGRIAVMPANLSIQTILRDVAGSTGHRYAAKDNAGNTIQDQGIHTGISSGRTEGYNRIVKHVGPIAFGFRNTANQPDTLRLHPSITPGANQNPEALLTLKTPVVAIQIRRRRVGAVTIQRTPADGAADSTEPPHGKATSSVATDA